MGKLNLRILKKKKKKKKICALLRIKYSVGIRIIFFNSLNY